MKNTQKLIPKLRFPEFVEDGEWTEKTLNKLSDRVLLKNRGSKIDKVFTNSATRGIIDQREYFDKDIANKGNLENYYVVKDGDYVYNPRISSEAPVGPISKNKTGHTGVMSPLYTAFRFKSINNEFYEYYFNSIHWYESIRKAANTGARFDRMSITDSVFMDVLILYPQPAEQQKIAACLTSLDELISAHNDKLETLKDHKKGLMQNLFPNPSTSSGGQTIPNYRFPEFAEDGEWVEKELGDEEVSFFVNSKIDSQKLNLENYFSTDNMLPDYGGVTNAKKLSTTGRVTKFAKGDILISNIRPYLKKVWKSDRNGGASNDVLVFRSGSNVTNDFLETILKNDAFISYVMESAKGVKMPRGDKDSMKKYIVFVPAKEEQQKIASCLSALDELISAEAEKIEQLQLHKKGLMQGLFPNVN